MKRILSRRAFLQGSAAAAAGSALVSKTVLLNAQPLMRRAVAPSDRMRFGIVGVGMEGSGLLTSAITIPGVECVGAADLYDGRHTLAKEITGNTSLPTTRHYQELLDRKDIDCIVAAVPDHWHRRVVVDACNAGKDVYCEKPMSHTVDDGFAMVEAAQKAKKIVQVGSQRVSSILYAKAKEIYDSGQLGEVYFVEAFWDRNSDSGAWVYPIPPDASEQTIDWNAWLDGAPKRPFDPVRFFRYRCFTDYGAGLAGDLFVHLISGIHFITGTSAPAQRAQSAGGLFRWKDGRDFPDLIETFYDYPNFRTYVRCNLNNDGGELIGFYGTKGTMIIKGSTLTYVPQDTRPQAESYSIYGWPAQMRNDYLAKWQADHPPVPFDPKVDSEP